LFFALRVRCTCDTVTARENGSFLTEMETNSTPSRQGKRRPEPHSSSIFIYSLHALRLSLVPDKKYLRDCPDRLAVIRLINERLDYIFQGREHSEGEATSTNGIGKNNFSIIGQVNKSLSSIFDWWGPLIINFLSDGFVSPPRYFGRESVGAALVVRLSLISREASDLLVATRGTKQHKSIKMNASSFCMQP
jgi:hypothetical protein